MWKSLRLRVALPLFVFLAVAAALIIYLNLPRQSEVKTVAVLPLRSLDPGERDQSLGLKLTDALIQRLGRLRQLVVRPTRAVQRYEGVALDPIVAGREQQVDAVLDGSFQRAGERLRVRVQLLRVSDGRQLWEGTFDERSNDPLLLQDALAEQTAEALVPQLGGAERALVARHDTENVEAGRLYAEGRYQWGRRNIEGLKNSVAHFDQAIRLDAWSQLGETDKALDLLERVYANRDYYPLYFKVHPNLDPLRRDPRFQDLLRRVGLAD